MIFDVFIYSLITALATGLGVIPFIFSRNVSPRWIARGNAIAGGLMVAASFSLIYEGISRNVWLSALGALAGLFIIYLAHQKFEGNEDFSISSLSHANAISALLIVGVMTIHSFAEGIGMGVAFAGSAGFGEYISTAIAVHNIPEGLAIALILIPMGIRLRKVTFWAIFSSLPQPLIAIPAFLFVNIFEPFLPFGLGLAGGAMIWMSTSELLPKAFEHEEKEVVAIIFTIALIAMLVFQVLIA